MYSLQLFFNCFFCIFIGQPRARTGFTSVIIRLIDVNDNQPEFTIPNIKDLKVPENSKGGTLVFKATAIDRDQGANGLVSDVVLCYSFDTFAFLLVSIGSQLGTVHN